MEEKMVDIKGQTLYFKKIGNGKYPLLMLHGFGGSSDGFKAVYPALSKQFTIVSVDLLGFGRSSKPMNFYYSFQTHANLYYKLMKKLGYTKFAVLGHSMGGEIALNLSYLYPGAVSHLVLIDAPGVESLTAGMPGKKPIFNDSLSNVSEVMAYNERLVKNNRNDHRHYKEIYKQRPRRLRIAAKEMTLPTLIVWGRKDRAVPVASGEQYHRLLKNSEFHIIEKGYHAPFRQYPEEFMGIVNTFFRKYPTNQLQ